MPPSGAAVLAKDRSPATDLSSLLEFLVAAYTALPPAGADARSVLGYNEHDRRLRLNTFSPIKQFLINPQMHQAFGAGASSGFLRDFEGALRRSTVKMGGRLLHDDLSGVEKQVRELKRLIGRDLDTLGITARAILVEHAGAALHELAQNLKLSADFDAPQRAALVPIEFAEPRSSSTPKPPDVARVISAVEDIQGEDWIKRLAASTANLMERHDDEFNEDEVDLLHETFDDEFEKPDSQITAFLNFLEDDALARVRLHVTFAIMDALAAQAGGANEGAIGSFRAYVQRTRALFDLYALAESEQELHINLTGAFGFDAAFSMTDELVRARFYGCLPVWAEWNSQILEDRRTAINRTGGGRTTASIVRDVSYRFRINGRDPFSGKRAFDARRERLRRTLIDDQDLTRYTGFTRRRDLAQLVFLWLVLNPDLDPRHMQDHAQALAARLNAGGRACVDLLLQDLERWSPEVKQLGTRLSELLQTQAASILAQTQRETRDLYLVVQRGIINWEAISRRGGRATEPLVKADKRGADSVQWFKHIKVARRLDDVPQALFSVRISTSLRERILTMRDQRATIIPLQREVPSSLLNVLWQPIGALGQAPNSWTPKTDVETVWRMGAGVDILYDPDLLMPGHARDAKSVKPEDAQQYRAAGAAAMAILVYSVLQVLVERMTRERSERLPITMLRFQTHGRDEQDGDGETQIYAIAQAVEAALMADAPVRMQGMVYQPKDAKKHEQKQRGTAIALASAFPLTVGQALPAKGSASDLRNPELSAVPPKIALIVYSTRPCDAHPRYPHADGLLYRAKTYLSDPTQGTGYRVSFDRMQSFLIESRDELKRPTLILEEISRLQGMGYEHIMLLSSDYGNRRINRTAQRHSPHTRTTFLDAASEKFPDLMVYTLRRDVFPAARLHLRERNRESAFEAQRLGDHRAFTVTPADGLLKQLIPTYTLCTLSIVGFDDGTRPQSGFCTYFLDTDYQVANVEWRERARANILSPTSAVREHLVGTLRTLHFLEAEMHPEGGLSRAVLDPFDWVSPDTYEAAGEIQVIGKNGQGCPVILSLPALLTRVSDALHTW